MQNRLRVKIKGYDHRVVDKAAAQIVKKVVDTGAKIKGPVPLPNSRWKMAVHRGPHIDAKSKEHVGATEHRRVLDIIDHNSNTIDALTHMQIPAGVGIEIK